MDADNNNIEFFGEMDIAVQVEVGESDAESDAYSDDMTTTSDDEGSTMNVIDYDFQWIGEQEDAMDDALPPPRQVTDDQLAKINQVPKAMRTKRGVNSLSNLCAAKILTMKLENHQAETHEFADDQGVLHSDLGQLKKYVEMCFDPVFQSDLVNLQMCWEAIPRPELDIPSLWREINTLKNAGVILALATIDDPQAQLLARNFLETYKEHQAILIRPMYYGYLLTAENLPKIAVAIGREVNKQTNSMIILFTTMLFAVEEEENLAIHGHLLPFVEKWLIAEYIRQWWFQGTPRSVVNH